MYGFRFRCAPRCMWPAQRAQPFRRCSRPRRVQSHRAPRCERVPATVPIAGGSRCASGGFEHSRCCKDQPLLCRGDPSGGPIWHIAPNSSATVNPSVVRRYGPPMSAYVSLSLCTCSISHAASKGRGEIACQFAYQAMPHGVLNHARCKHGVDPEYIGKLD